MQETDDIELLRQYANGGSEEAFTRLVARQVNLVYSVALRHTANAHAAEEITQAVFIILAQKARRLRPGTILSGWLYQTARLTAANYLRAEIRRGQREQEAYMQSLLSESQSDAWPQIAPLLDAAMGQLSEKDRNAIVLRFFENKSLNEVGVALGASEDAVKMRINRALDKLRKLFSKRGVVLTTAIIASAASANSIQAAPAGLVAAVAAVAVKGTGVSGSTLTLIKGALKLMAWTKAKTAVVIGVGVLLAAGTTTVVIKKVQRHGVQDWQLGDVTNFEALQRAPQQTLILPTHMDLKLSLLHDGGAVWTGDGRVLGINQSLEFILTRAYMTYNADNQERIVLNTPLPGEKFDVLSNLPKGSQAALQLAVKQKFGLIAHFEKRTTDVLLLKVNRIPAPGLRPTAAKSGKASYGRGNFQATGESVSDLLLHLEKLLAVPIIDQTGLTNHYDLELKWHEPGPGHSLPEELKQVVLDQLGLELIPSREPIEMLVIERATD